MEHGRAESRKNMRLSRIANPEKARASAARWRIANPDADRRWSKERQRRKILLAGPRQCNWCGMDISDRNFRTKQCTECAAKRVKKAAAKREARMVADRATRRIARGEPQPNQCLECGVLCGRKKRCDVHAKAMYKANRRKRYLWLKKNSPETLLAQERNKRTKNPQAYRAKKRRYRARRLNQLGSVSASIEATLLAKQRDRCAAPWCHKRLRKWHLDHIVPLALGGLHDDSNLQILCVRCNLEKSATPPDEWQKQNGSLPLLEGA